MANDNYVLTEEGKKKLEEELHYLENEKRAEIGERIKVARRVRRHLRELRVRRRQKRAGA